jgi:hypothetical protein
MQPAENTPAPLVRRLLRVAAALLLGVPGLLVLFRADSLALCVPILLFSTSLASPPAAAPAARAVRDVLDSTTEIKPTHVLLFFLLVAAVVLSLSFSGPFWSWLTDHIRYQAPASPVPSPMWARLLLACLWFSFFCLGVFRTFRAPTVANVVHG